MGFSLLGFGVLKFRFGGIVPFSRANDIFNKLDSPEAPSLCPKFVFTLEQSAPVQYPPGIWEVVNYRSDVYAVVAKDIGHRKCLDGITDLGQFLVVSKTVTLQLSDWQTQK